MAEVKTLPAQILVQVRDGVPNRLASFKVEVLKTRELNPEERIAPEARLEHVVNDWDVATGLAIALKSIVAEAREFKPDDRASQDAWLKDLCDWIVE